MNLFEDLLNVHELSKYFYWLYNQPYSTQSIHKASIKEFIDKKSTLLEQLDYSISQNRAFISLLFDFCELFGFISTIRIENTLKKKDLYLGKRREAAKLYLLNVRNTTDYLNRFDEICSYLQCAVDTEEDDKKKALITFINYYAKVVLDTSDFIITPLREKITSARSSRYYSFILDPFIGEILSLGLSDIDKAYAAIQEAKYQYLNRNRTPITDYRTKSDVLLIEKDTEYSNYLSTRVVDYEVIKRFANEKCSHITERLPGRGVTPLSSVNELYLYLRNYGNMHKAKIISAIKYIQFQNITNPVTIIDWGCGQGLASFFMLQYLQEADIPLNINEIILIEPSEVAIKRAALHLSALNKKISLRTINSAFKDVEKELLITKDNDIKFHLFSNVLDIGEEHISHDDLLELIEETQKNQNFFICVSPYIDDFKADRVDSFMRHYAKNITFNLIKSKNSSKKIDDPYWLCNTRYKHGVINHGQYTGCGPHNSEGCMNKWTRVIRVFSVNL
ncbi:MAG: class I SAM-dependent methyltransferase [Ignavibacteria bacterium]|nr:class I SAM-dependent methyltransferase [Ignavibacteria bacterium]